jgi:hypothetical protein
LPRWGVINHMVYCMCRNSCFYRTKRKKIFLGIFFFWIFFFWIWLLPHTKLILNIGGWIDPPIECARRLTSLINILMNLYNQLSGDNSKTVISLLLFGSFKTCNGSTLVFCFSLKPIILTSSTFILDCVLKNTNLPLEAVNYQI